MPKSRSSLVNRGPAGLLRRPSAAGGPSNGGLAAADPPRAVPGVVPKVDEFCAGLEALVVPLGSLVLDPLNARQHGDRNLAAIMASLSTFGQLRPAVVRAETGHVMSGNGMVAAMRRLGWTRCARLVRSMTDAEAAAYALADNRTAELATWDFATVRQLERIAADQAMPMIGWSAAELAEMRAAVADDPVPDEFPEVDEDVPVDHVCPRCGYAFSGGKVQAREDAGITDDGTWDAVPAADREDA